MQLDACGFVNLLAPDLWYGLADSKQAGTSGFMRASVILAATLALFLGACGATPKESAPARPQMAQSTAAMPSQMPQIDIRPRILSGGKHLQCVPYARAQSGIQIRGDAWSWWPAAKGKYRRGAHPHAGAVMVFSRSKRLKRGHLAYVRAVISPREIIVSQANWLNRGKIHEDIPVRDVSANNDWSLVRVWYVPGGVLGKGRYAVSGFIYPNGSGTQQASAY